VRVFGAYRTFPSGRNDSTRHSATSSFESLQTTYLSSADSSRRQAESSYRNHKALCLSARMDNNSAQSLVCLWRHDLAKACLTRAGRLDPSRLLPWMDPGGLFWQARLSHRDVIAMCSVARSRQSYRYRTVVWALQGGKCLESGLLTDVDRRDEGAILSPSSRGPTSGNDRIYHRGDTDDVPCRKAIPPIATA